MGLLDSFCHNGSMIRIILSPMTIDHLLCTGNMSLSSIFSNHAIEDFTSVESILGLGHDTFFFSFCDSMCLPPTYIFFFGFDIQSSIVPMVL